MLSLTGNLPVPTDLIDLFRYLTLLGHKWMLNISAILNKYEADYILLTASAFYPYWRHIIFEGTIQTDSTEPYLRKRA